MAGGAQHGVEADACGGGLNTRRVAGAVGPRSAVRHNRCDASGWLDREHRTIHLLQDGLGGVAHE
ncbi:hypothetical protein THIOKS11290004 [Thiocapsa sp. KS1]|nr:hypothetical protein THIOKS11290004 [Thiocapsa sp. KS1]